MVSEWKPKTVAEAGRLADDYAKARSLEDNGSRSQEPSRDGPKGSLLISSKRCHSCGRMGHLAKDCRQGELPKANNGGREGLGNQREKDGPRCYSRQQKGHFAKQCPSKPAMFCSQSLGQDGEPSRTGRVRDRAVEGILLDTGAATTYGPK